MLTQVQPEFEEFYYFDDLSNFGANLEELKKDYSHIDVDDGQSWIVMKWKHNDGERFEFYHISDFLRFGGPWTGARPEGVSEEWHGYKPDGYSGIVLIALSDDNDGYKVAYFAS